MENNAASIQNLTISKWSSYRERKKRKCIGNQNPRKRGNFGNKNDEKWKSKENQNEKCGDYRIELRRP